MSHYTIRVKEIRHFYKNMKTIVEFIKNEQLIMVFLIELCYLNAANISISIINTVSRIRTLLSNKAKNR